MASAFANVQTAPPIEVFQLGRDFAADTNPKKVPRCSLIFICDSICQNSHLSVKERVRFSLIQHLQAWND